MRFLGLFEYHLHHTLALVFEQQKLGSWLKIKCIITIRISADHITVNTDDPLGCSISFVGLVGSSLSLYRWLFFVVHLLGPARISLHYSKTCCLQQDITRLYLPHSAPCPGDFVRPLQRVKSIPSNKLRFPHHGEQFNNRYPPFFLCPTTTIIRHDHQQGAATRRNKAASATSFVKVVRALLRSPPRNATAAASTAVAVPVPASEAEEEDSIEAATHQIRTTMSSREPRTALDISGHRFAKNLQVREEGFMYVHIYHE